jgi:DNA invertase Pin-like site-specific DNA recombinase
LAGGRPKANLNWDEIGKLLAAGCPTTKIASQFGVNERTFYDRCNKDLGIPYSEFSRVKRSKGDNIVATPKQK